MIKLSLQSLSYKNSFNESSIDLDGIIQKASKMRMDGVDIHYNHFKTTDPKYLEKIRLDCLKLGLKICYIGLSNNFLLPPSEIPSQINMIKKWVDIAYEMKSKLLKGYIDNFGELLGKAWETKKKFSPKITNQYFDEIYDFALKNGALGGKLLGAGSGGYYLFYVPTFKKLSLIKLLEERGLKTESITFDNIGLRQWITKKKV